MDLGLLVLRLILAALLFGHSTQKVFGWFRGQGARNTAASFEKWGLRPGLPFVILSSVSELIGATLIVFGAFVPLGTTIVVGTMTVAIAYNFEHGLWAHLGGFEVALVYALLAVVIALTGPGQWSMDHLLGSTELSGPAWAGGAILVGVLGATGPIAYRNYCVRRAHEASDSQFASDSPSK
ncbi:MAG TPA: DoxX family protein [Microbacteriaceae bacterium]